MQNTTSVLARRHVAATLFWRGFLITLCAAIAVRWPAAGLLLAMAAVGVLAIAFGVYDLIAAARYHSVRRWWVLLLHGVLSLVFGAVSITALALSRREMVILFAAWLALASAAAMLAAVFAGIRRTAAVTCLTIFLANAVAIVYLATDSRLSALILLYAGACYATLFGITEVGLGQWLRRGTGRMELRAEGAWPHR